jgi:beta-glucosidase-like glycosyl hydrolase
MIDLRGTALTAEEREWLESPLVGGVILFSRNFEDRLELEQLIDLEEYLEEGLEPPTRHHRTPPEQA